MITPFHDRQKKISLRSSRSIAFSRSAIVIHQHEKTGMREWRGSLSKLELFVVSKSIWWSDLVQTPVKALYYKWGEATECVLTTSELTDLTTLFD